ncbi:4-aminobutyrate aminotransferase [Luminiphilus syltensis NOR5-1B]|uniref:4-aminobutyrate aminotransferase n=1 Tax=Luminiphilus syltensis NOR5-1B TaxID=565045 RepID=B8KT92_9GAMM|nr:aminotransferase class III-fold pyridoxal phosphate-dependent enzyme [Luminiphilus syltensis]EED34404.1 4-aminobutyrate aminotransferase [Luminiphilus syltensis NOR5-1B]
MTDLTDELLRKRHRLMGRFSPLFYEEPIVAVKGEGCYLWDADGRQYLDAYNNVPHVGHCHSHVVDAITRQASTLNVHTRYLNPVVLDYSERLLTKFDDSLESVIYACSGSEANEAAVRMARHYTGKQGVIVTDLAYHGNTEAIAEMGTEFMPESRHSQRVATFTTPDRYRAPSGLVGDALAAYFLETVDAAIAKLQDSGAGVAALLVCPGFANEGIPEAPPAFLSKAAARVREAGGLIIADEVQFGFGRSATHWFSHQKFGVIPDIVTLGKPMGNGHPISAVLASRTLVENFGEWGMYFNTFAGNPVSCAAANAVLDVLETEQLLPRAERNSKIVFDALKAMQSRYDCFGDVREGGLFFAVDLVDDPVEKTPATALANKVVNQMRQRGVLISRIGPNDNVLKIRPPLAFDSEHADQLLTTLESVMEDVTGG